MLHSIATQCKHMAYGARAAPGVVYRFTSEVFTPSNKNPVMNTTSFQRRKRPVSYPVPLTVRLSERTALQLGTCSEKDGRAERSSAGSGSKRGSPDAPTLWQQVRIRRRLPRSLSALQRVRWRGGTCRAASFGCPVASPSMWSAAAPPFELPGFPRRCRSSEPGAQSRPPPCGAGAAAPRTPCRCAWLTPHRHGSPPQSRRRNMPPGKTSRRRQAMARTRTWTAPARAIERERTQQIARIGNNLNQLARWANTHKTATEAVTVTAHLVSFERIAARRGRHRRGGRRCTFSSSPTGRARPGRRSTISSASGTPRDRSARASRFCAGIRTWWPPWPTRSSSSASTGRA